MPSLLSNLVLAGLLAAQPTSQPLPRRGFVGLPLAPVAGADAEALKIAPNSGIKVNSIPAELQNLGTLRAGDVIVAVAGKAFTSGAEFTGLVRLLPAGQVATLTVLRAGERESATWMVRERPRETAEKYDVIYDQVVSNGWRIRTIITKPKGTGKFPVLFWIQGIGSGSVDSPLSQRNYLNDTLRPFAEDGFVTVRIEKHGIGDSEGDPIVDRTFDEESDIYRQALKALDGYAFIDRSRVFVFGHSMGGCHAPIVCNDVPVKGIAVYGTVSDSWLEWAIKAARFQSILAGADPAEVDRSVRQTVAWYHYIYNEKLSPDEIVKRHPEMAPVRADEMPNGTMSGKSLAYFVQLNDKNFPSFWSRLKNTHVLALFGENDFIAFESDHPQIALAVNRTNPGFGEFKKLPGMDHAFGKTTSMRDSQQRFGQAEHDAGIVSALREWIQRIDK